MNIRKIISTFFIYLLFPILFTGGCLRKATNKTPEANLAIKGYDTVAYFNAGKAVKGNPSYSFTWHGKKWLFSSSKNTKLFADNPKKYAPQYDGYCAWALTENRKSITDPEVWKIVNGKLYLNCSQSAYEKWIRDIPGHIKKADANWLKISGKK